MINYYEIHKVQYEQCEMVYSGEVAWLVQCYMRKPSMEETYKIIS